MSADQPSDEFNEYCPLCTRTIYGPKYDDVGYCACCSHGKYDTFCKSCLTSCAGCGDYYCDGCGNVRYCEVYDDWMCSQCIGE